VLFNPISIWFSCFNFVKVSEHCSTVGKGRVLVTSNLLRQHCCSHFKQGGDPKNDYK
jgi:hypothetical protein